MWSCRKWSSFEHLAPRPMETHAPSQDGFEVKNRDDFLLLTMSFSGGLLGLSHRGADVAPHSCHRSHW